MPPQPPCSGRRMSSMLEVTEDHRTFLPPPHPLMCKHAAYPKTSITLGLFSLRWHKHKRIYYIPILEKDRPKRVEIYKREVSGIASTAC